MRHGSAVSVLAVADLPHEAAARARLYRRWQFLFSGQWADVVSLVVVFEKSIAARTGLKGRE
jgi:hypothetical protein